MPPSLGSTHQRREARVKLEVDASKQWYGDWGSLYAPDEPTDYEERIHKLKDKANTIPGVRLRTTNAEYGVRPPFKEFKEAKVKKPDLI